MISFVWTNKEHDCDRWDRFLQENPRGQNLQLSTWLKSYKSYGFEFELLLVLNLEGEIIAGVGVLYVGITNFKALVTPGWAVIEKENEELEPKILGELKTKAKQKKCF